MTDEELIDKLGGTTAVAAALEVSTQLVSAWKKRGISDAGRFVIADLARKKRLALPPDFFDIRRKNGDIDSG